MIETRSSPNPVWLDPLRGYWDSVICVILCVRDFFYFFVFFYPSRLVMYAFSRLLSRVKTLKSWHATNGRIKKSTT